MHHHNRRPLLLLIIVLLLTFGLAACEPAQVEPLPTLTDPAEMPTETPTEIPTEAPTEAPTETPTEEPTETPTEAPAETPTEEPTAEPTEVPTEEPTAETAPAPVETVTIVDSAFQPAELTVPAGTTITWVHQGRLTHTVTANDGSFNSGNLRNGDTFSFTFSEAGSYPYYCRFHGSPGGFGMAGTITVTGE